MVQDNKDEPDDVSAQGAKYDVEQATKSWMDGGEALGLPEGGVSTTALTPQQEQQQEMRLHSSTSKCPDGHFYLYVDPVAHNETWENDPVLSAAFRPWDIKLIALCKFQSGYCQPSFRERLDNHPCRTQKLTMDTPIVVGNLLHRAMNRSHSNTVLDRMFTRGFESSYRMLQNLPGYVRSHPHVYLFETGEHQNMRGYDPVKPRQAITIGTGDPMWVRHSSRDYDEPRVPDSRQACYLQKKDDQYVTMPYFEPFSKDGQEKEPSFEAYAAMRKKVERPLSVFYYAGLHGMGVELRSRLYDVCDAAQKAGTGNWVCPKKPLPRAEGFRMLEKSKFCLIPVGDAPGRVFMFQAIQRGCIPVLFSSCTDSVTLHSLTHLLPADPAASSSSQFGKRKWSMLMNQTAVMSTTSYLIDALDSISEEEVAEMRAAITDAVARRVTFSPKATNDDALAFVINHILRKGRGLPAGDGPSTPEGFQVWYPPPNQA